jgi:hypothetical protein
VTLQLVVADACSIMNFAPIDRMPLLNVAMRERGRWTQAVEGEIRRSANTLEFRKLSILLQGGWLGEAVRELRQLIAYICERGLDRLDARPTT